MSKRRKRKHDITKTKEGRLCSRPSSVVLPPHLTYPSSTILSLPTLGQQQQQNHIPIPESHSPTTSHPQPSNSRTLHSLTRKLRTPPIHNLRTKTWRLIRRQRPRTDRRTRALLPLETSDGRAFTCRTGVIEAALEAKVSGNLDAVVQEECEALWVVDGADLEAVGVVICLYLAQWGAGCYCGGEGEGAM